MGGVRHASLLSAPRFLNGIRVNGLGMLFEDVTYESTFLVLLGKNDSVEVQFPRGTPVADAVSMAQHLECAVGMARYNLTFRPLESGLNVAPALLDASGKVHHIFSPDESFINMKQEAQRKGLTLANIAVSITSQLVRLVYMKTGDPYFRDFRTAGV